VTDTRRDPREHLVVGPTGFRLAPSNLTLHDLKRSNFKVVLCNMKYVTNGNSYDVGLNGDYRHLLYFGWVWDVKGQGHNPLTQNISKTMTDARLDPAEHLYVGPTDFRLAPSDLTLCDLQGSNINVILFDVKCQERQHSRCWTQRSLYRLHMGFTLHDLERL